ncbi:hypothetical protein BCR41DRAFT_365190, partial [Lobosporangium transversale]
MESDGSASVLLNKNSPADADYQCFRSNNSLIRVKVTHSHALNSKYVYWSDLKTCFPGITRVQLGDIALTFMRGIDETRLKPFRIEYIPGAVLDVIYNTHPSIAGHVQRYRNNGNTTVPSHKKQCNQNLSKKIRCDSMSTGEQGQPSMSSENIIDMATCIQRDEAKTALASLVARITKETLAEQAIASPSQHQSGQPLRQQQHQHRQSQQFHQRQHCQPAIDKSTLIIESKASASSSLASSNESEYDVVDDRSLDQGSAGESNPLEVKMEDASSSANKEAMSRAVNGADTPLSHVRESLSSIHLTQDMESRSITNDANTAADEDEGHDPLEKVELGAILSLNPPPEADDQAKAEFEALKQEVVACFHLFYAYFKSTTGCQLLQAERRGRALVPYLEEVHTRIPKNHALRHQLDLLMRETIKTKILLCELRHVMQTDIERITNTHYGVFEHLEQKMFVILPESDTLEDGFRLHFLCESCQLTQKVTKNRKNDHSGDVEKKASTLPHHLHFSKHEGYKLRYAEEFVARYGHHMWVLLQMLLRGYKDQGVSVPPIPATNVLAKKIQMAIRFIECEPDPGDREGSWDFSRVGEFYVPVSVSKEGSVGSLFRIITEEGYAKWVCFEHYREQFPMNDYKVLQGALKTFFYNEALGAVLVSLGSRKEASDFYEAIIKASNLQELGMQLKWDLNEQDIKLLEQILPRTTAVSIKILVPFEHHIVSKAVAVTFKDQTRGIDIHNPDYALGHYKTNLIRQAIDNRRIQAFYLDILDHSAHSGYEESLNLTLRNNTTFEKWSPDQANPALCDMVRTGGPLPKTKLSFNSPTLERGFFFMNNAIKGDVGLVILKAMVNYYEQVSIRSGKDEARKSMRIQHWSSSTLKFANKLERLWLEVRTPQETRVLQQLIELNPYLKKLRITTEANTFYKIYEAVQKTVVVRKHKVPLKLVLRDGWNTSLTWSELVVAPERKQDQFIALEYTAGVANISTILMFFGYIVTHLRCLELTNLDVKTLEACTRSRGSNITNLEVNIMGLNNRGISDLIKIVERSHEPMSQPSSRFSVHLRVLEDVQPDWTQATELIVALGSKVDELVLFSSDVGSPGFEYFLKAVSPATLPFLEALTINGSGAPQWHTGTAANTDDPESLGSMLGEFPMSAFTAFPNVVSTVNSTFQGNKGAPLNHRPRSSSPSPHPISAKLDLNQTTSPQLSSKFLPWLESFASKLPLQKLGLNFVLLETEEWRSILSKLDFSELEVLDLMGSKMTMAMFYELPLHFPTYDRYLKHTSPPVAPYDLVHGRRQYTRSSNFSMAQFIGEQSHSNLNDIIDSNSEAMAVPANVKGTPWIATISKQRQRRMAALQSDGQKQSITQQHQGHLPHERQQPQQVLEKRRTCTMRRVRLPSTSDFKLERYQKVMIQNEIRALLIGCDV